MKNPAMFVLTLCFWSTIAHAGEPRLEVAAKKIISATTTVTGQPIVYPRTNQPKVTALIVEIPPGAETGWQIHPAPVYAWMVAGMLTVEFEGGKSIQFKEGDAIIHSVNTPQNCRNNGSIPVKLLIFSTGAVDVPIAVKALRYDRGAAGQGTQEPTGMTEAQKELQGVQEKQITPTETKDNTFPIKLRYKEPVIE